jgi:hypothetical protein
LLLWRTPKKHHPSLILLEKEENILLIYAGIVPHKLYLTSFVPKKYIKQIQAHVESAQNISLALLGTEGIRKREMNKQQKVHNIFY